MTADLITVSRMVFSVLMLVFPVDSPAFWVLYVLCGVSDMLDGFIARKLHTESERGARLDSAADGMFAAVYAVRVLPRLVLPIWILIWAALIAAGKLAGMAMAVRKEGRLFLRHSTANRITGLLIFLLPLWARFADARYGAAIVCAAATYAAAKELTGSHNA